MLTLPRKIRYGLVGGGPGAFIGDVHRAAMRLNGNFELVCGAFSSDEDKCRQKGKELDLPTNRVYATWQDMIFGELKLPADERMDVVVIVTPNHLHFPVANMAINGGFHVICEKPATFSLNQAKELESLLLEKNSERELKGSPKLLFGLTHNYTGYPMAREMRALVANASSGLGPVRAIRARYLQGWLAKLIEQLGQKQSKWRTDKTQSGAAGAIGDIGTHAFNLIRFICPHLEVEQLLASLRIAVTGRQLDDNATVLMFLTGNIPASIEVSQIAHGHENDLSIEIDFEHGGMSWRQEEPNTLLVHHHEKPTEVYRAGHDYLAHVARSSCLLPPGHPEGYLEAFAQIYDAFAHSFAVNHGLLEAHASVQQPLPSLTEAVEGMLFIESCVESSEGGGVWVVPKDILWRD